MSIRVVCLLLFSLVLPAASQHTHIQQRINQSVDQHQQQISQVDSTPDADARAARLHAFYQDANELSELSASVQSDLQKLQQGLLVKDLHDNLKKMEKLSKKVRQEME